MMNVNAAYAEKCVTPDEAVTLITSGSHLSMGMFAAEPPALLNALAKRAKGEKSTICGFTVMKQPALPGTLFSVMS